MLAHGERSGHAHVARGKNIGLYHDTDAAKGIPHDLYIGTLVVTAPARLTHDEHAPIELPANSIFVVTRQRELSAHGEQEAPLVVAD